MPDSTRAYFRAVTSTMQQVRSNDPLPQLQKSGVHKPRVPYLPSVPRRQMHIAWILRQDFGARAPETLADHRRGEGCFSMPELPLSTMSALPQTNADRKQISIRQVRSHGLDMWRLLNPRLEPEGPRLEQEDVAARRLRRNHRHDFTLLAE